MKLHAAVSGEGQEIGLVEELEGRMLFEKICYPVRIAAVCRGGRTNGVPTIFGF